MKRIPAFIVFCLIVAVTSCNNYGQKISYNNLEIYYKDGVSREEASRLGDYIIKARFVSDLNEKKVFKSQRKMAGILLAWL